MIIIQPIEQEQTIIIIYFIIHINNIKLIGDYLCEINYYSSTIIDFDIYNTNMFEIRQIDFKNIQYKFSYDIHVGYNNFKLPWRRITSTLW